MVGVIEIDYEDFGRPKSGLEKKRDRILRAWKKINLPLPRQIYI
jgi:hypothetical protein